MKKNILITGIPRSGKSTLLKKLISDIPNKIGFVTNEILKDGERVGFEIETHLGHRGVLAHVDITTPLKVSKYFVNTQNLDSLIPEVSSFKEGDFLYLDEIGQMELYSESFKKLTLAYLNSANTCLMTLSKVYQDDFTDSIRKRADSVLIELTPENRDEKESYIKELLSILTRR